MKIERYESTGRMSRVVCHGDTLYLCGQTAGSAGEDIKTQTEAVLARIDELLGQYGSDREHMLMATIYLKDMSLFGQMNEIWAAWVVPGAEPARACVEAKLAAPNILVEIVVTAAKK